MESLVRDETLRNWESDNFVVTVHENTCPEILIRDKVTDIVDVSLASFVHTIP